MQTKRYYIFLVFSSISALLACSPLFSFSHLGGDYTFPLWMLSYLGEYYHQHQTYASSLSTEHFVGLVHPIFYGFGFFRLLSPISAWFGGIIALRIAMIFVFLLQALMVYRLFIHLSQKNEFLALVMSSLISWNVYALTTLYTRGAITEFIAITLLTCSFCCFLQLILLAKKSPIDRWGFGIFFTLAAVTHPITFQYGILFLTAFILPLLPRLSWSHLRCFFSNFVLMLLVLSPWLYLVLFYFHHELAAKFSTHFEPVGIDLDAFSTRLMPFPYDKRSLLMGRAVSVPYLDAQINMPLLVFNILLAGMALRYMRWLKSQDRTSIIIAIQSFILFVLSFLISTPSGLITYFGHFFDHLQFGYRIITYINLSLLGFAAALIPSMKDNKIWQRHQASICTGILCAAFIGLLVQKTHISLSMSAYIFEGAAPHGSRNALLNVEQSRTPYADFMMKDQNLHHIDVKHPVQNLRFSIGRQKAFGELQSMDINIARRTRVITNVIPFPWNRLNVDGTLLLPKDIISLDTEDALSVVLEPGTHHLEYVFTPDPIWYRLSYFSHLLLIGWLCVPLLILLQRLHLRVTVHRA